MMTSIEVMHPIAMLLVVVVEGIVAVIIMITTVGSALSVEQPDKNSSAALILTDQSNHIYDKLSTISDNNINS